MLELSDAQTDSLPKTSSLQPHEIHLWFCRDVLRACNLPSDETLNRSVTIQQQQAHHFILHRLLAAYLGYPVQQEDILRTPYGKPYVINHLDLKFNISHTEKTFIAAFSPVFPLGIDLESCHQSRPFLELSERFFSKNEHYTILSLPPEAQKDIFLQLWTAKEAVLKAHGTGISKGLDQVELKVDIGTPLQLSRIPPEFGVLPEWQFVPLRHAHEYVGALAWRGEKCKISIFEVGEIS